MTGQVDAVTGWLTNTTALKVLGAERVDMALWDTGVQALRAAVLRHHRDAADARRRARRLPARLGQGWA